MSLLATLGQFAQDSFDSGSTSFETNTTSAGSAALGGALFLGVFIVTLIIAIPMIIALWKIFVKAGKPGWAALVPFYNNYIMVQIAGLPIIWFVLMFVPYVNAVASIYVLYMLSKSFGKDAGFTALLVLLPFIGFPILGFGKAQYQGPAGGAGIAPGAPQNQAGVAQFPTSDTVAQNNNTQSQGFGAPASSAPQQPTPPVSQQPNQTQQNNDSNNQNPPQTPPTFG